MKKINTTKLVALLAALCLMTSAFVGSTLAKYTSEQTGTATARVAKWGFGESTITFDNLFALTNETNVAGKDGAVVIAPGTTGSASFDFKPADGATEVAYSLTVDTDGSTCAEAIQNNSSIVWSLNNEKVESWSALLTKIQELSVDSVAAGTDKNIAATIGWEWTFEKGTANEETGLYENDATDTEMGIAGDATVTLSITVTATQLN